MFADFDWLHAVIGSPIMLTLFVCSIATLAVAIERGHYYWTRRGRPQETLKLVLAQVRAGDLGRAQASCAATPHPLGSAVATMLRMRDAAPVDQEEQLLIALSESKLTLERNLGLMGTMAAAAPLIGLLGTVYGIMQAFHDMGASGSSAPSVVAAGVAEALLTTGLGLIIAIPSLLLYNHFTRRLSVMLTLAENGARTVRSVLIPSAPAPARLQAGGPRAGAGVLFRDEVPFPVEIG